MSVSSRSVRRSVAAETSGFNDPERAAATILDGGPVEVDERLVTDLIDALKALTPADVDVLLASGNAQYRSGIARVTKLTLNPKFMKAGLGRIVTPRLTKMAPTMPVELAELLFLPTVSAYVEEILGDRFDEPSASEVAVVVTAVVDKFGTRVCRAYLLGAAAGGAPAGALLVDAAAQLDS